MSTPINWAGAWSGTTTYGAGDAVSYLGSSFIAVTSNTNVIPTSSEATWNLLAAQGSTGPSGAAGVAGASGAGTPQGLHWRGAYSALTAYNAYDCVSYSNSSYICTANGVLNKEPDNNPAYWGVLCVGNGEENAFPVWGGITGTLSDQEDLEAALNAKADTSSLATVATSGSYADLSGKPSIPAAQVQSDWNAASGAAQILNKPSIPTVPTDVSAFTNDVGYLTAASEVPATHVTGLATVATSGSYTDLANKPSIPSETSELTNNSGFITEANVPTKVSQLTNDSAYITSAGAPVQSVAGKTGAVSLVESDIANLTADLAAKANTSSLATVATSGSYTDLESKPTLFTAADITAGDNVIVTPNGIGVTIAATGGDGTTEAVWGEITGTLSDQADLEAALDAKANTASLATVATSGSYTDLANKPTIPSGSFSDVSSGTNSTATMVVGTGGTLNWTGTSDDAPIGPTITNTTTNFGNGQATITLSDGTHFGALFKACPGYSSYKSIAATDLGFYNGAGNISILADGGNVNLSARGSSTPQLTVDASSVTSTVRLIAPAFTSSAAGLAPASGGGTSNFLRADGAWAAPPSSDGGITAVAHDTSLVGDGNDTPLNLGALQSKSANYTMLVTDLVCLASGTITITLTTSGASVGKLYRVKNTGAGTVTIQAQSGTIDGGSTAALSLQYQSVDLVWDGSNFWIL